MHRKDTSRLRAALTSKSGYFVVFAAAAVIGGLFLARPLFFQGPLAGDNISNPILINANSTPFNPAPIIITAATTEFADPDPGCGTNSKLRTMWYQYTAPNEKVTIVVDTTGS